MKNCKLMELFNKYREIIMYLIFGVLTTVVSLVVYFACTKTFLNAADAFQLQCANVISWFISVLFAFVTNRVYVFESKGRWTIEMLKFYSSRVTTLILDMLLMFVLVTLIGVNDMVSKIIVQFVVIVANYVLSKLLVFKEAKK